MPRYVAFLRALNVGGRRVKMDELCELFVQLRFKDVETFIASGNVIFESPARDVPALAAKISAHLERSLGYEATAMVRTPEEIAALVEAATEQEGHALHIVMLERAPSAESAARIIALGNDVDRFELADRALYWWCRGSASQSTVTATMMERASGMRGTARSINSLRRLLERIGAA